MRALLVSTYDLGRQPFGLASPAAWLRNAGVEVECVDTSRQELRDEQVAAADVVGFYLPMHTATRLSEPLIVRVHELNPHARIVAYGLYAPLNEAWLRGRGVHDVLGPEAEAELVGIAGERVGSPESRIPNPVSQQATLQEATPQSAGTQGVGTQVAGLQDAQVARRNSPISERHGVARLVFIQPDRSSLPALANYASLHMPDGSRKIVGSTDATRGCKHLCRHCPIVPVYRGAFRVVPLDVVMQDVRAQVAAGAEHISFGDPDFLNGPTHARRIVEQLASEFPQLTYDVTIKIEHLLKHTEMLPLLAGSGCLFVTSAVESVDDAVLERLRKGHTRADFAQAVALCRAAGLTLSPTFVAFTPWTTLAGYLELLQAIAMLDLIEDVAPVQLAIRLLITAESALLELPDILSEIGAFDGRSLTYPWRHADPAVDALQQEIMALVASGGHHTRGEAFAAIWDVAHRRAGRAVQPLPPARERRAAYISEPWYCCAEPAEFHL